MNYSYFSKYYDQLMNNVDYKLYADSICKLMKKYNHVPHLALDLACGTGSLTLELHKRGIDVYGVDSCPEMLSVAQTKAMEQGENILYLCQPMEQLNLYGTIDTAFCTLDSLNHLPDKEALEKAFARLSLFMEKDGLFIFDMNTMYKHKYVLNDNTFVYELNDIFCVWQNHLNPQNAKVDIQLDFFEKYNKLYRRTTENFSECAYEKNYIEELLKLNYFDILDCYSGWNLEQLNDKTERIIFIAKKIKNPLDKHKNM